MLKKFKDVKIITKKDKIKIKYKTSTRKKMKKKYINTK